MDRADDSSGAGPEPAERPAPAEPGRRRVVLLVEDDEVDRHLYGGLLWYNGYDVVYAEDGESAVEKAVASRPDLVLLDIRLAGELSGLDVARLLRDRGVGVPMIVLSALSQAEAGAEAEAAGVTAYIEKPADPFDVVREVMRRIGEPGDDESTL